MQYAFFSAANAKALQEARRQAFPEQMALNDDGSSEDSDIAVEDEEGNTEQEHENFEAGSEEEFEKEDEGLYLSGEEDSPDSHDPRAKVLSVLELEALFVEVAPDLSSV